MKHILSLRAARALLLVALALGTIPLAAIPALADIKDYEFQLIEKNFRKGEAIIALRLIDKRTGKPVPDAVIFTTRIDMAPDGMETMTSKIEVLPSTEPGVYRLKAGLTMEGGWRLSLGARIQGETGTLESKLILKAMP